jgi:hypothetical protein
MKVQFDRSPQALNGFDHFVQSCPFLNSAERCAVQVAGNEVLDNLLTHGEISPAGITMWLRRRKDLIITFFCFESHPAFARFAARMEREPLPGPRYDPVQRRWHGLGLTMCRNISHKVRYRSGELIDRVILEMKPR